MGQAARLSALRTNHQTQGITENHYCSDKALGGRYPLDGQARRTLSGTQQTGFVDGEVSAAFYCAPSRCVNAISLRQPFNVLAEDR